VWSASAKLPSKEVLRSNQVFGFMVNENTSGNLLMNGGFEFDTDGDNQPDAWNGKNLSEERIRCNKDKDGDGILDKVYAASGDCAYQFKGSGVGESSGLDQAINALPFTVGSSITLDAQVRGTITGSSTKFNLKLTYADGTKGKLKLGLPEGTLDQYTAFETEPFEVVNTVSAVKFSVKNKSTSGKWYLDDLRLQVVAPSTLQPAPLPLPGENTLGVPGANGRGQ
jgi:hypothetical protein